MSDDVGLLFVHVCMHWFCVVVFPLLNVVKYTPYSLLLWLLWRRQSDSSPGPLTPGCVLCSYPSCPHSYCFLSLQTEAPQSLIHSPPPPFLLLPLFCCKCGSRECCLLWGFCCASGWGSWLNWPPSLETEGHPALWNAEGEARNDDPGAQWSGEDHLHPHPDESHDRYGNRNSVALGDTSQQL